MKFSIFCKGLCFSFVSAPHILFVSSFVLIPVYSNIFSPPPPHAISSKSSGLYLYYHLGLAMVKASKIEDGYKYVLLNSPVFAENKFLVFLLDFADVLDLLCKGVSQ